MLQETRVGASRGRRAARARRAHRGARAAVVHPRDAAGRHVRCVDRAGSCAPRPTRCASGAGSRRRRWRRRRRSRCCSRSCCASSRRCSSSCSAPRSSRSARTSDRRHDSSRRDAWTQLRFRRAIARTRRPADAREAVTERRRYGPRAGPRARLHGAVRARGLVGRHPPAVRQLVLLAPAHRPVHPRPRHPARRHLLVHRARHPLGRAVVARRGRVRRARPHGRRHGHSPAHRDHRRRDHVALVPARAPPHRRPRARRPHHRRRLSRDDGRLLGAAARVRSRRRGRRRVDRRGAGLRASRSGRLCGCPSCSGCGRTCTASFALGVVYIGLHVARPRARRRRSRGGDASAGWSPARSSVSRSRSSIRTAPGCSCSRCSSWAAGRCSRRSWSGAHPTSARPSAWRSRRGSSCSCAALALAGAAAHRDRDVLVGVPFVLLALWAERNIGLAVLFTLPIAARALATTRPVRTVVRRLPPSRCSSSCRCIGVSGVAARPRSRTSRSAATRSSR